MSEGEYQYLRDEIVQIASKLISLIYKTLANFCSECLQDYAKAAKTAIPKLTFLVVTKR